MLYCAFVCVCYVKLVVCIHIIAMDDQLDELYIAPVRRRAVRSRGAYFDQVLCNGLWVDFDSFFTIFRN